MCNHNDKNNSDNAQFTQTSNTIEQRSATGLNNETVISRKE